LVSKPVHLFPMCIQFSSVVSDSLWPHELQHTRPPCPSPTPRVHPNSCPLSQWCHPTISSSIILFSSCPQSFPALWSFQMSQLFASGGQSIGVSASTSVLPKNTQDWSPLGWTGWMASPTRWTWVWVDSGSWWWTGRPGMLRFTGSQRVGHDWVTELNWNNKVLLYSTGNYIHYLLISFNGKEFEAVYLKHNIVNQL